MTTVATVTARLTGIHVERAAPLFEETTYLSLKLLDGQNLRVPTTDPRTSNTLVKKLPREYRVIVEVAE